VQRTVSDGELIRLAEEFGAATPDLGSIEQYVVRDPTDNAPYEVPYIPFVGSKYRTGGVLVYATAQNLRPKTIEEDPDRYRSRPLLRLYPTTCEDRAGTNYGQVHIQPWRDGILPALVAMWLLSREAHQPRTLDEVHQEAAVSNFYKQSLRQGREQRRDKNPGTLSREEKRSFVEQTLVHYVRPEVELLRPSAVMMFRGPHTQQMRDLCSELGARCYVVNDPSWVKRGMGGVFRPDKSWARKIEENRASLGPARELAETLLKKCESPYNAGKREAALVYLLKYYLDWKVEHSNESSGPSR
jgi:hypothetical protein